MTTDTINPKSGVSAPPCATTVSATAISLADLDKLPEPADLAEEIIDNIEAGLSSFRAVTAALQPIGSRV